MDPAAASVPLSRERPSHLRIGLLINGAHREEVSGPEYVANTIRLTAHARDCGFDAVVIGQHLVAAPYQFLQPIAMLSRLAVESGDMRLGTGILLLPLFNPVDIAEQVATLDVISGGRAVLGVGLGYRPEEFEAFGVDRRHRVKRLEESIAVIQELWKGGPVDFTGEEFRVHVPGASLLPVQRNGVPIWLAAMKEPALRRVRRLGLTPYVGPWVGLRELGQWRSDADLLGGCSEVVARRDIFVDTGRSDDFQVAADRQMEQMDQMHSGWGIGDGAGVDAGEDERLIVGDVDQCRAALERYAAAGVTEVVLRLTWPGLDIEDLYERVRLIGRLAGSVALPETVGTEAVVPA